MLMTFLSEKLYNMFSKTSPSYRSKNMKFPVLAKNKLMLHTDTVPGPVKRENNSSDDLATTTDAETTFITIASIAITMNF